MMSPPIFQEDRKAAGPGRGALVAMAREERL